jgi:hypothetical protein
MMVIMWVRGAVVAVSTGTMLACSQSAFICADDEQCGDEGICEASGFCSFPDPACDSGRRYGKLAGKLAGACVDPSGETTAESAALTEGDLTGDDSSGSFGNDSDTSGSSTAGPSTTSDDTTGGSTTADECAWSHERPVTIDGGLSSEPLTNFPVLVRWTDGDLGDVAYADGRDIRFLDEAGEALSHEIERLDVESGTLVAWVRVPSVPTGVDTTLRMQWGNARATAQDDPTGVWDDDFLGVWHMGDVSGAQGSIHDSTLNAYDGTPVGGLSEGDLIGGVVGLGLELDGEDDSITIPNDFKGSLTQYTLSVWANITQGRDNPVFWRLNGDYLYPRGDVRSTGSYRMQLRVDGVTTSITSPEPVQSGIHHLVFVYSLTEGVDSELWLDGELISNWSLAGSSLTGGTHDLALGVDIDLNGQLLGLLDEVQLSNVVRSHAWIQATYRVQAPVGQQDEQFVTLGPIGQPTDCE